MRRMVCLVAAALIAQLAMVSGVYAEDCNPTTPTIAEIGLFDTATWICPVETQRPGRATNDSVHGDSALTYYVRVLDQRACPISGFKVLATSSDFDPTPSWEPGQILWFVVSAERRASAVDDRIGLLAPGDGCRGYIDRIEIHDIPVFRNPDQVLDHTVLFRPAAEADRSHPSRVGLEGGSYLYALGSWPPVWLSVDSADAERVITWAEVLSSRGEVAAVGANYAEHDSACGDNATGTGTQCTWDTDCGLCHDGSPCGTVTTRAEVMRRGDDCRQEDSAECEYSRVRCCGGRCMARPF